MKILLFTISILIASYINILSQWSTDPNNNLIVGYGLDPHICSDSAGGCYISYDYNSTSYPRWLALERLDRYGSKPWGINKRILGESPEQSGAQIIEDDEGGVIMSYIDRYENLPNWTQRVRVQRVDRNGNFLWGQTGVRVTLEEINQGYNHLVTDGYRGCVIAWQDINYTYYVNRIDFNSNRLWGNNGITLSTGTYNLQPIVVKATDENYYVKAGSLVYRMRQNGEIVRTDTVTFENIIADNDGGIVISGRVGNVFNRRLVAQRKDSLGNNLWHEPYVEIADSLHINTLLNIRQNNDYYYYSWVGKKNGLNNRAQFQSLRQDGSLLFSNESELLSSDSAISKMGIIPSGSSKIIFCWNIPGVINTTYSQLYDTLGNKFWNENGVIVAHPNISYQSFTTDNNEGFIIGGTINEFTIVAQQVSKNGYLGEIITNADDNSNLLDIELLLQQNFPNPFNSSTLIRFRLPAENKIKITLYNVLGEKIQTITDGFVFKGMHSINFSSW